MTALFAKDIAELDWLVERGFSRREVDDHVFDFVGPGYTIRLTDDSFSTLISVGSARLEWTDFAWVAQILGGDEVFEHRDGPTQAEQMRCLKTRFEVIDNVLRNGDLAALTAEVSRRAKAFHAEVSARIDALRK